MTPADFAVPSSSNLAEPGDKGCSTKPAANDSAAATSTAPPLVKTYRYRWRMVVTAILLWGAWGGIWVSPLTVQPGSLPSIVANYCGWMLFFGGLTLRVWSTRHIGGRKSYELVCSGPYSLCRNPLYVGTFLMILSLACFLKSLTFTAAAGLVIVYYCVAVVPLEERFLSHKLGAAYQNYCQTVPRWWPRRSTVYTPPVAVIAHPMRNELRRAVWWLALPLVAELNLFCRSLPEWPQWLNLP